MSFPRARCLGHENTRSPLLAAANSAPLSGCPSTGAATHARLKYILYLLQELKISTHALISVAERFAPVVPRKATSSYSKGIAAVTTERVPKCHRKAEPLLHRLAKDDLVLVIVPEGVWVLALGALVLDVWDCSEIVGVLAHRKDQVQHYGPALKDVTHPAEASAESSQEGEGTQHVHSGYPTRLPWGRGCGDRSGDPRAQVRAPVYGLAQHPERGQTDPEILVPSSWRVSAVIAQGRAACRGWLAAAGPASVVSRPPLRGRVC
eukprot:scaffold4493_cov390-Prasinococcus_capsulatus_cf.AAC.3